jgi:glycosyltransferase involved in cell wall biosynthesis
MFNFNLSIIIPCLNESENLKKLIPEIKSYIGKKFSYEILIIDGMEKDHKTTQITTKYKIKYFNRKNNNDY